MSLIGILVVLVVVGVLLYIANTLLPIDARIKVVINAIVLLVVFLWILEAFGLFSFGPLTHPTRPLR